MREKVFKGLSCLPVHLFSSSFSRLKVPVKSLLLLLESVKFFSLSSPLRIPKPKVRKKKKAGKPPPQKIPDFLLLLLLLSTAFSATKLASLPSRSSSFYSSPSAPHLFAFSFFWLEVVVSVVDESNFSSSSFSRTDGRTVTQAEVFSLLSLGKKGRERHGRLFDTDTDEAARQTLPKLPLLPAVAAAPRPRRRQGGKPAFLCLVLLKNPQKRNKRTFPRISETRLFFFACFFFYHCSLFTSNEWGHIWHLHARR